jgi:hypothetical protein
LTSHLARRTERAEAALKKSLEEKETKLQQFREKLGIPGATIEDTNIVKTGYKALKASAQEEACLRRLEKVKSEQKTAQDARRTITEKYHTLYKKYY